MNNCKIPLYIFALATSLVGCKDDQSSTMTSSSVAVPPQYIACSDNSLNSTNCFTSSARYVYTSAYGGRSTLGAAVNGANGSLTATIPQGWYDGTTSATMSDTAFIAKNIKQGVTLFGLLGTQKGNEFLGSSMSRTYGTTQITLSDETTTYSGTNTLPTNYRAIPTINVDDDGFTGGNVSKVDRSTWGISTCGTTQTTIDARIADCVAVFASTASWDGTDKGNAGQALWKLVTRTGSVSSSKGREVWLDTRTGLLWSSLVSTTLNWCKGAGSHSIAGNTYADTDPSNVCNNSTYQNTAGSAISACYEGTGFSSTDANIDIAGKTGLSLTSTPVVAWRLPTIYDYKQAEVDGIRFVMPDGGVGSGEWAATIYSTDRSEAWFFDSNYGATSVGARTGNHAIRCVGR
ncbi:MAG TPA: hypothetical protein VF412_17340 [Bdellovibrio sp.]|uniref:hypothetical protein n=1 Tax=Bdellovibrio sp. TaxID=28201 RepID=UPI002EE73FCE